MLLSRQLIRQKNVLVDKIKNANNDENNENNENDENNKNNDEKTKIFFHTVHKFLKYNRNYTRSGKMFFSLEEDINKLKKGGNLIKM